MTIEEVKLSSLLADLILAIKEDDLDRTKHIVNDINNQNPLTLESNFRDFQTILSPNIFYNDSAVYAVTNLNNIDSREEFLTIQQINRLYLSNDKGPVIEFLENYGTPEKLSTMKLYLVARLYQLCVDYELWDKLEKLRDTFNSIKEV